MKKEQIPSPEEIAEIEKERTISDAELLKTGAEYVVNEKGEKRLEPTNKQIRNIEKEHTVKGKIEETIDILKGALKNVEKAGILKEITIGGKTKDELVGEMKKNKVYIYNYAQSMIDSLEFTTSKKQEHLNLVRISVKDLGLQGGVTTEQIYARAKELGLELCPAEVGPQLRLQYLDQPNGDYMHIGMKAISGSHGSPDVFYLFRDDDRGLSLISISANPGRGWNSRDKFVFRLPRE